MRVTFILKRLSDLPQETRVISHRIGRVFTGNNLFLLIRAQWTKAKTKYTLTELAEHTTAGNKCSGHGLGLSFPINVLFCLLKTR